MNFHQLIKFYILIGVIQSIVIKDKAPEFFINLDEPIETRFNIFKMFTPYVQQYVKEWMEFVMLTKDELEIFDKLKLTHPDRELIETTESLANVFQVPFNQMLAFQYEYDFGAITPNTDTGCTSIVIQPYDRNVPYIARNLDYGFQEMEGRTTVMVHFYQGSKKNIIYTNLNVVGQLTIAHTLKSSYASITMDRLTSTISRQRLIELISEAKLSTMPRYLIQSLISSKNYEEVKQKLMDGFVLVHGYAALVGTQQNEACIIHVDDTYPDDNSIYLDNEISEVNDKQNWFLVTNGDDNEFSKKRKEEGEMKMSLLSQDELSNPQVVVDRVLSQYPNKNIKTIFTVIMISNSFYCENQFYY